MDREDLKKYRYSQKWIQGQLDRYEEQRERALGLTKLMDGMPHAQNKLSYVLEELIDKYNEILRILNKDQEKQNEIIKQLRLVDEPYRTILSEKYIEGKSLEQISIDISYSYDRTCKMHGTALNKFDEINESGQ